MFKKLFFTLFLVLVTTSVHALGDNNNSSASTATAVAHGGNGGYVTGSGNSNVGVSNRNENTVKNTIDNSNRNTSINKNTQGQLQGQFQSANNKVSTDIKVDGDSTKSTAIAFPSVMSAEGTNSAQATYLFGSLGKSNTEPYKKYPPQIQTILAIPDDVMSKGDKTKAVKILVTKMIDANRTQRMLGFGWEDNSKNLLNLFGLLTWDSVWAEGQKPFQCKSDIKQ